MGYVRSVYTVHDWILQLHTCGERDSCLPEDLRELLVVDPQHVLLERRRQEFQVLLLVQDLLPALLQVIVSMKEIQKRMGPSPRWHLALIEEPLLIS
jgi:hypothetical protein